MSKPSEAEVEAALAVLRSLLRGETGPRVLEMFEHLERLEEGALLLARRVESAAPAE